MAEENPTFQAAARPSGKRQATGAETSVAKKPARTKETNELSTRNPIVFIKQVADEMRKVIWPTGRQMVTYSVIVIAFLIVMIALVWGVDTLAGLGVRSVLGK
ncbi:MAG: preprotein translocase subunit SecE [Corynebacterium sp.]|uniref:preprotein translocase subunit SecE n=1 Tax=Corynebacterium sp. TaxID=1720 RepID=UPI0026DAEC88|nr:preprotein translocase subunit SecE [Corynebacterium sp.]MDO5030008.1 preprotein translocase subunit SecE [Corynebacterium sp.]